MLVAWIRAEASQAIPDGLITDRVPAGLEVGEPEPVAESGHERVGPLPNIAWPMRWLIPRIKHTEFRDDRYVAAVALGQGPVDIFYLLRVVTPGRYAVPSTVAEDMYRPEVRGVGASWRRYRECRDRGAAKP